jgi:PhzF family phenazine biosynthesis protein
LKFSETAFVMRLSDSLFSIRYFTPNSEIELCGHATIAAFKVLQHLGLVQCNQSYSIHTLSGNLPVYIEKNLIFLTAGTAHCSPSLDDKYTNKLCKAIGASYDDIGDFNFKLRPQIVSTGLYDIMLPIRNKTVLMGLKPDYRTLSELSKELKVVGVHAFNLSQVDFTATCRNFAPLYGIEEESATGTSNASLTCYLYSNEVIKDLNATFLFRQGENMGRPSNIYTKILSTNPLKILVGGNARITAKGSFLI